MFGQNNLQNFLRDESGAVTVDWVALVATLILIGVALAVAINSQTIAFADRVSTQIDGYDVMTFN